MSVPPWVKERVVIVIVKQPQGLGHRVLYNGLGARPQLVRSICFCVSRTTLASVGVFILLAIFERMLLGKLENARGHTCTSTTYFLPVFPRAKNYLLITVRNGMDIVVAVAVALIAILVVVAAYAAYHMWTEPKASEASPPKASEASPPKASEASPPKASEASPEPAVVQPEPAVAKAVTTVTTSTAAPQPDEPQPMPTPTPKQQPGVPVVAGRWGPEVAMEVERYYMQRLRADKTLVIEPKRLVTSGTVMSGNGVFVPPKTPDEKLKIALIQRQIMRMLTLVKRSYATDKRAQNLLANYSGKVGGAVFPEPPPGHLRILGVMATKTTTYKIGKSQSQSTESIMAVDLSLRVALSMNVIAHEMAHAALRGKYDMRDKPPNAYIGSGQNHGPNHTATWKWLLGIGIKAGWQFVEFPGPSTCRRFRLCNPRVEIPGAQNVVFSGTVPMGDEDYTAK